MNPHVLIALSDAPLGRRLRVRHLGTHPELSSRLREMGFFENAVIRCITKGDGTIICEVCNTRVGMNNRVARTIIVSSSD